MPVLQIGADYFCDSHLIADVLDELAPWPGEQTPQTRAIGALIGGWAEPRVFVMAGALRFRSVDDFGGDAALAKAFASDRGPFMAPAADTRRFRDIAQSAHDHVRRFALALEDLLADGRAFIAGGRPSGVDFDAALPLLWLRRPPARDEACAGLPRLEAWLDRIAAIGPGEHAPMSAEESLAALAAAQDDEPWRFARPAAGEYALGARVSIQPGDYGRDPIAGEVVALTDRAIAIVREVEGRGRARVWFPRMGFEITPA